jgi:hypothetical protein
VHHDIHVRAIIVGRRFLKNGAAGAQLVQDLLEPKLVSLVDDDEEHFIMRVERAFLETKRSLQTEQFVHGQIASVVGRLPAAFEWAFHRRTVAHAERRSQSCRPRESE